MSYERLQITDGIDKWDSEKVKHLEDAIIKNEEDIKKYHNDNIIEIQANWSQGDANAKDYIKNRTHYMNYFHQGTIGPFEVQCSSEIYEGEPGLWETSYSLTPHEFIQEAQINPSSNIQVIINDTIFDFGRHSFDNGYGWYDSEKLAISYDSGSNIWSLRPIYEWQNGMETFWQDGQTYTISLNVAIEIPEPLDEKYIPSEIARKSQIPDLKVMDWNINKSDQDGYIKNRTHYIDKVAGEKLVYYTNYYNEFEPSPNVGSFPYVETIQRDWSDHWLGGNEYLLGHTLLNADTPWEWIDEDLVNDSNTYYYRSPGEDWYDEATVIVKRIDYNSYELIWDCNSRRDGDYVLSFCRAVDQYVPLDDKFIPNTVTRKVDWNNEDENSPNYVHNKPCYELPEQSAIIFEEIVINNNLTNESAPTIYNNFYRVTLNNEVVEYVQADCNYIPMYEKDYYFSTSFCTCRTRVWQEAEHRVITNKMTIFDNIPLPCEIKIERIDREHTIYELDDKFIPSTIARVDSVVTSVNGQTGNIKIAQGDYIEYEYIEKSGWEVLGSNIRQDDENVVLKGNVDIDNLRIRLTTPEGHEDIITNESDGLTISRKSNGTYVLVYLSGVENNTAVYEFRLKGNIDGSGAATIPYITLVDSATSLKVESYSEAAQVPQINESLIPDTIARKEDLNNIKCAVTSVNGQIGNVVIPEGIKNWDDLQDKPFYYTVDTVFSDINIYMEKTVPCEPLFFNDGDKYVVIIDDVSYDAQVSYNKNNQIATLWLDQEGFRVINCAYFNNSLNITIKYVRANY